MSSKVSGSSPSNQPQVNLSDAKSITDYAKKNLDNSAYNTNHGQDTQDSYNKVVNAPTVQNATKYVTQLSSAAATENNGLSGDDAQKVKDAAVAALHHAGVSDDNINQAINKGFVNKPDTSYNPG